MSEHEVVVIVGFRGTQADVRWIGVDVAKDAGCKVAGEADGDLFPHVDSRARDGSRPEAARLTVPSYMSLASIEA
jgi:hypothetical protein